MEQRYCETTLREKRLLSLGYVIESIWACQFQVPDNSELSPPIELRDAYYGGRTNALKLYHKFENGKRGRLLDFISLYPWVLKYCRFPVSHPEKIFDVKPALLKTCNGNDVEGRYCPKTSHTHFRLPYFGIAKIIILPPTNLLHPVLPYRCTKTGKLKFPLCAYCAENDISNCSCPDEKRAIHGTYCTPEIETALDVGYKIITVHEVLHWRDTSKYDTESKKGGLFVEYVNTFLKIKQEASGVPSWMKDDDIEEYIKKYEEHEGIKMNKNNIKKVEALRSLAKLLLNSFYGKFGQRLNLKQTHLIDSVVKLQHVINDPKKNVTDFRILTEDVMQIESERNKLFADIDMRTNVIISAFTTAWARLKLWCVMYSLGSNVFYTDTDSLVFEYDETNAGPETGEFLGDLSDELSCKKVGCAGCTTGHWIVEFVACGPKNYGYKLNTGDCQVKVRGFSLNYKASQIINYESLKQSLMSWYKTGKQPELVTVSTQIARDKLNMIVYNREVPKHYGIVYDKNVVTQDNYRTVPHGFQS